MMKVRRILAPTAAERSALYELLRDSVTNGASVGYVVPVSEADIASFWSGVLAEVNSGERILLVAENTDEENARGIVGSAQLSPCGKPNGRHRAEVQKVLVHSAARRQGIGRALMAALETEARAAGRWLLVLDTETQSNGQQLYAAMGYQVAGIIPDFAIATIGEGLVPTTYMYKKL